jgi:hypothetical protein
MTKKIIALPVPTEKLGDFKDYVGYLFLNENGVYSVMNDPGDIQKASQWFKARPLNVYVVSKETVRPGEKILGHAVNKDLNHKVFTYLGFNKEGIDLCDFEDENGKLVISTKFFLGGSYKFLGMASPANKKTIVRKQSLDIFSRSKSDSYDVENANYASFSGRSLKKY